MIDTLNSEIRLHSDLSTLNSAEEAFTVEATFMFTCCKNVDYGIRLNPQGSK